MAEKTTVAKLVEVAKMIEVVKETGSKVGGGSILLPKTVIELVMETEVV